MAAFFAIFLLLAASALADEEDCLQAQQMIWNGNMDWKEGAGTKNFEYNIELFRDISDWNKQERIFYVKPSNTPVPSIVVDAKSYELLSLAVIPLNIDENKAALQIVFDDINEPQDPHDEYISFVVPLIAFENNEPEINTVLTKDLLGLENLADDKTVVIYSDWIEPLVKYLVKMDQPQQIHKSVYAFPHLFLTHCQNVSVNVLKPLLKGKEDKKSWRGQCVTM